MLIHNVQQNTPEWDILRAGIPTMSAGGQLITSKGLPSDSWQNYAITLAAEKYAGKPMQEFFGNRWTERGHELEPEAADLYEFLKEEEVKIVGFITDDKVTYGCSPDRFVGERGLLEIKSLKTEEHIKVMMYYMKHKRVPSLYVIQPQGQILVCEKDWCDSFFYHPDLPPVIHRHEPNEKLITALRRQIEIVCAERDRIYQQLKEF